MLVPYKTIVQFLSVISVIIIGFFISFNYVLAASNIDATYKYAYSETAGWVDFSPSGGGVEVTDTSLLGYAYGETFGWIDMQPQGGGVLNDGSGNLTGYSYSEAAGWINFDPPGAEQVIIDPKTGEFSGYAYSEAFGWISFNCKDTNICASSDYKVVTSWRGIVGQLSAPQNVHHTSNTTNSITWVWDPVLNATTYYVYLLENGVYNPVGITNSTSFVLSALSDKTTPLLPDTNYTIKVKAVDSSGSYTDSVFSNPASAYTSADIPINLKSTDKTETSISWSWQSGGGESGFYALIKENTSINSGWLPNSSLSWVSNGLTCGSLYTLQVKAKNGDGDETSLAESGIVKTVDCNQKPIAGIVNTQSGNLNVPFKFTGGGSSDDRTQVSGLKARWDFNYDGVSPSWDIDYSAGKFASDEVSYQYNSQGTYKAALQVKDEDGLDSDISTVDINVSGPVLAINPLKFPTTNSDCSYYFGIIEPTQTKDIDMLICNLGKSDLTVDLSFSNNNPAGNYFSIIYAGKTYSTLSFTLNSDPQNPTVCNVDVNDLSRKKTTLRFNPKGIPSSGGGHQTFTSDFKMLTNDASPQCNGAISLRGTSKRSAIGKSATENIIYDGRIISNPPPGFVEFLEKLQFSEKVRPR